MKTQINIAVLIDAENASAKQYHYITDAITKAGHKIVMTRAYADWSARNVKGWAEVARTNPIETIHKIAASKGKSSSDMVLITDAMRIAYTKKHINGICFVSSDADFTYTAQALRDEGLYILGIGESKTPAQFISACEDFIITDSTESAPPSGTDLKGPESLVNTAYENCKKTIDGLVLVSDMGHALRKVSGGFNKHQFGYDSLGKLISSIPGYQLTSDDRNVKFVMRTN